MPNLTPELRSDVAAVQRLPSVPQLLKLVCQVTGMGFAVIARVTNDSWTACAVQDDIGLGVKAGGQLALETTLCTEVRTAMKPLAFDHASVDPVYSRHHTPRLFGLESYVSVPIVLPNGDYFGNLCAVDRKPAEVANPKTLTMFAFWADLIAAQLADEVLRARERQVAMDERAAGELREQFIAVLGHDLRNPLSAVVANAALLERKVEPSLLPVLGRIRSSARRMEGLIDDVLDFARGRLGSGLGMAPETVDDLGASLAEVVSELRAAHPEVDVRFSDAISHPVRCDRRRVQQLLSNLLGNAITHGSPDSPIDVVARTDQAEFVIAVTNHGEPIPSASLSQVFSPFWRKETAGNREGLGLGLYICSQIAREHGGRMEVTSTAEGGTTFTARLPLDAACWTERPHTVCRECASIHPTLCRTRRNFP